MKIGDTIEFAIWMTGEETREQIEQFYRDCRQAVAQLSEQEGFNCASPELFVRLPGEERVPKVPDHISGPNVRLLVIETVVVSKRVIPATSRYVDDLDAVDLARLRIITRREHQAAQPGAKRLTDAQCDDAINQVAPETALRTIREQVDLGTVH